jgi:hypothetical protein
VLGRIASRAVQVANEKPELSGSQATHGRKVNDRLIP